MEIIAQRSFGLLYIILDSVFILTFLFLLFLTKRKLTFLFALFGGILYFAVDYGIFHALLKTRSIEGGNLFWVLLWMSMSYGVTNFAWIWLCLRKDNRIVEWTLLIFTWWLACPMLDQTFGGALPQITIRRTTGSYHGYMAIILFLSYLGVIIYNLFQKDKLSRMNLLWLFTIGVAVQFGWEFSLLIGGIRSVGFETFADKLHVLIVNSLVETNLGMPLIYCIFLAITSRVSENLSVPTEKRSFSQQLQYNNTLKYRQKDTNIQQNS